MALDETLRQEKHRKVQGLGAGAEKMSGEGQQVQGEAEKALGRVTVHRPGLTNGTGGFRLAICRLLHEGKRG